MIQPKVNWKSVGITAGATFVGCLLALGIVAYLLNRWVTKRSEELNAQLLQSIEASFERAGGNPAPRPAPRPVRRPESALAVVRDENENDKNSSAEVVPDDQNRIDPQD